jgi:hypothetical protein
MRAQNSAEKSVFKELLFDRRTDFVSAADQKNAD